MESYRICYIAWKDLINDRIKIEDIPEWLRLNQHKLSLSIEKSSCYKWTRWQADNSIHVFPCVCRTRNEECIFAEIYYEVWKVFQMVMPEEEYISALMAYSQIGEDKVALEKWMEDYKYLGKDLYILDFKLKVAIEKEPYRTMEIILPLDGLIHLQKFKEIYCRHQVWKYPN